MRRDVKNACVGFPERAEKKKGGNEAMKRTPQKRYAAHRR
ncbi:hypothetical protein OI25_206 [Paraburkholderia fungorum]|uniref:Uncharacterized protein n=1 Tax=Paraburkholderia fungorum TaxID=134537 RepID=A0AAU8SYM8_9BURK|nr:hypothetical protein OI25_206 [Paraburkholderia fungorum]